MARKGNQQRNGLDRNSLNHKIRVPESGAVSMAEKKEKVKSRNGKAADGEEPITGNQTGSPSVYMSTNTNYTGDDEKNNQRSRNFPCKEKPIMDSSPDSAPSVPASCNPKEPGGHASASNASGSRGDRRSSLRGNDSLNKLKTSLGFLLRHLPTKDLMEASVLSDHVIWRSLGASALSIFNAASGWVERQKPLFFIITTTIFDASGYARLKIQEAYPIVWRWLVQIGKLMLLISMIWLDCSLRGLDSLVRFGTTSFFAVIWCSILSLVAMIGIFKFLIVTAIAALVAVYIGFTLATLFVAISASVLLWLYGSFWTTGIVILLSGVAFTLSYERVALLITTLYSIYCAKTYVGWLGLLLGMNLSFISSDILVYFLKNNMNKRTGSYRNREQMPGMQGQSFSFHDEAVHPSFSENASVKSTDRSAGEASTSRVDSELTSEDEVVRLLNCTDHYSALGFSRYETIDVSLLKREYRKKAMLVHPDKNMGNEKAAEAFKKLQNAYEVLLDSLKRKTYDDELRREEILDCLRRFQNASQRNGRHGLFSSRFTHQADGDDPHGDSRRIACKKCGNFHIWVHTFKSKARARWCQDCKDFHQAKDGDGWVEQSFQPFLFGLLQKVDAPSAYVCVESRIYNATEWFICQGMNCPANTHKPSFHVNTSIISKHSTAKGTGSGQKGGGMPAFNMEESMTEEEFFDWLQNAMQSGMFEAAGGSPSTGSPTSQTGNFSRSGGSGSGAGNSKRKKKGRKQW
ncbi:uncharacterized protein LOC122658600 [Telopea speciosissima]|uniref:uncharacterized protein LOC122658600 n=1 Tax=Telopea speciosissima TaxID=54955 RepID=UPI001CC49046|nr:uncharacterized protein LOC122658600 [Telopea speciosissima]